MPNHQPRYGQEDRRSAEDRLKDLRAVRRQVRSLITIRDDPAFAERIISDVRDRRVQRTDRTQFDLIPDKYGSTTLAAARSDQLLIRAEDDRDARAELEARGLQRAEVDGLDNRVVAYTAEAADVATLARLAADLRMRGVPISANYMTPMGGYVKYVASPEETVGETPQFPQDVNPLMQNSHVRLVIIDTGVYGRDRSDGWLRDLETDDNREVLDDSPAGGDGYLDLAAGHGSFCTGIVQQIVPGADIEVWRELDSEGLAHELDVAIALVDAVRKAFRDGKDVVLNLSFGVETADDERPVALGVALEIIDEEARKSKHDALVVAAAGNFGHNRECYPAAFPTVTAVAALTQELLPAGWSSRGSWVDVCTIGEGVRSTFVPGTESPETDSSFEVFLQDAWALWSGTSFAAPQVAAAVAKIAIEEHVSPSEALRRLLRGATTVPLYGKRVEILPRI